MSTAEPVYETIGHGYPEQRRADPRIAAQIAHALAGASRVLNVGAGAGNYEPHGSMVNGLDPSITMLQRRDPTTGGSVIGVAERLPLVDDSFDAVMGTLTMHHWTDLATGLREAARVAERQVFMTYDADVTVDFWVVEYFPEMLDLPHESRAPSIRDIDAIVEVERVRPIPVPHDCTDGFSCAYWRRPERYCDPAVQQGMSSLALLEPAVRAAGTERLRSALESGAWDRDHGHLRELDSKDYGYRLVESRRRRSQATTSS